MWVLTVVALVVSVLILIWQAQAREDDNDARILAGCRDRNSAQELARQDLRELIAGINVEIPDATEALDRIKSRLSTPSEADTDCDHDGWLTVNDYTVPKPSSLPIQLPVSES